MQARPHLRLVVDNSGRIGWREKIVCRDFAARRVRDLCDVRPARHSLPGLPKPNGLRRNADQARKLVAVSPRLGKKFFQGHVTMIQQNVGFVNNKRLRDGVASVALTVRAMPEADSTKRGFAKRLASARHLAGFATQKAFAKHLGVEAETYRRWERGETEPNISMLVKLSDATGVSLEVLLRGAQAGERDRRTG